MRAMPTAVEAPINPNDGMAGGFAQKRRQFGQVNQHYISHNAVLPPNQYDFNSYAEGYTGHKPPVMHSMINRDDPYAKLPLKPNQVSREHLSSSSTNKPAGVNSMFAGGRVSNSSHAEQRRQELANVGLRSFQPSRVSDYYDNLPPKQP